MSATHVAVRWSREAGPVLTMSVTSAPPPDWSVEEWQTHYTERHGPVVAAAPASRHILRYTQGPTWSEGIDPAEPGFDPRLACLTQVRFRDHEAMDAYYNDPGRSTVQADELLFCDYDTVVLTMGHEHVLVPEAICSDSKRHALRPRINITVFRQPADRLDTVEFQRLWLHERGPAIAGHPSLAPYLKGYVQTHSTAPNTATPRKLSAHAVLDTFTMQTRADALDFWTAYRSDPDLVAAEDEVAGRTGTIVLFWRSHDVIIPVED